MCVCVRASLYSCMFVCFVLFLFILCALFAYVCCVRLLSCCLSCFVVFVYVRLFCVVLVSVLFVRLCCVLVCCPCLMFRLVVLCGLLVGCHFLCVVLCWRLFVVVLS